MARGDSLQGRDNPTIGKIPTLMADFERVKLKVETMTGERGDATKSLSTVRRAELKALASLTMQSKHVTAAPTMAEYNALQADVHAIFAALSRISNMQGTAVIPKI